MRTSILLLVLLALSSTSLRAGPISFESGGGSAARAFDNVIGTNVLDDSGLFSSPNFSVSAISGNSSASAVGVSSASGTSDSVSITANFSVDNTLDNNIPGSFGDIAQASGSFIFTANTNSSYELSGSFSVTGDPLWLLTEITLTDLYCASNSTCDEILFWNQAHSINTPNEQFTLGVGAEGDHSNELQGSLSGSFIAGRQYILNYNYIVQTANFSGETFTTGDASSNLLLSIGSASSSVPEPHIGILLLLGLLGIVPRKQIFRGHYKTQTTS